MKWTAGASQTQPQPPVTRHGTGTLRLRNMLPEDIAASAKGNAEPADAAGVVVC
ncbi:MAG: hypothetical protein ABI614_21400 [Planctomycetota bacterium]